MYGRGWSNYPDLPPLDFRLTDNFCVKNVRLKYTFGAENSPFLVNSGTELKFLLRSSENCNFLRRELFSAVDAAERRERRATRLCLRPDFRVTSHAALVVKSATESRCIPPESWGYRKY